MEYELTVAAELRIKLEADSEREAIDRALTIIDDLAMGTPVAENVDGPCDYEAEFTPEPGSYPLICEGD